MNLIDWLVSYLGFNKKSGLDAPVDLEAIARKVQVKKRALKAGKNNEPPTHAIALSIDEQAIVQYVQGLQWESKKEAENQFGAFQEQWIRLYEQLNPSRLQDVPYAIATAVKRVHEQFRLPLAEAREQERQADRDLRAFRTENNLEREPRYPAFLLPIYAGLGIAIVLEGAINSWAFAEALKGGFLAGLQAAMVLAGVNVLAGFAAGNALRGFNHVRWPRRLLAAAAAAAYAVFLVGFTLLVGHYRDALLTDPDHAQTQAVTTLVQSPFAICEFNSLVLMICSVGFALGAVVAGYHCSDPYPGHAAVHQHYQAARAQLQGLIARFYSSVDDVFQQAPRIIEQRLTEARIAHHSFRKVIAVAKRLVNSYQARAAALVAACQVLIQRYRQIVVRVRNDPPPTYFAQEVRPSDPTETLDHEVSLAEAEKQTEQFPHLVRQLEEEAGNVKRQVLERHQKALEEAAAFVDGILSGAKALPETAAPAEARRGRGNGEDTTAAGMPRAKAGQHPEALNDDQLPAPVSEILIPH